MKYVKLGVLTAFAGLAFVACSGETSKETGNSSVSFKLSTDEGVELTEVTYDLDEQDGTQVKTGVISVPNDDSVINAFIGALPAADYSLGVTATGTYNGSPVSCATETPSLFSLDAGQTLALSPNPVLVCTVEQQVGQEIGNVTFEVDVEVETIQTVVSALETFTVAPTTAAVTNSGGTCTWAPIGIDVDDPSAGVTIAWAAAPDGTLSLDADNTDGTYTCASPGTKTLTVTATLGGVSASVDVPVICRDATTPCGSFDGCGDGNIDPDEDCDDNLEGCNDCQVTCGDGELYVATEACDDGNLNDGDGCDASCEIETCPMGELFCSGVCVDPSTDEANCGACGAPCATGETCSAGVCSPDDPCPGPAEQCGTACVDLQTDPNNCGSCGNVCSSGSCAAGVCGPDGNAACLTCINTVSGAAGFNESVCDPSAECVAARDCALAAGPSDSCYTPIPAECYCGGGADLDACEQPTFEAFGECEDEIRAGMPAGMSNGDILTNFYSDALPAGQAMLIVEEARVACASECGL